ncbi:hypothetical protein RB598_001616 [Gaeumannomyces tritici]
MSTRLPGSESSSQKRRLTTANFGLLPNPTKSFPPAAAHRQSVPLSFPPRTAPPCFGLFSELGWSASPRFALLGSQPASFPAMLFPEQDAPLVKAWIVKRLENTSDADIDVLADYVLALLGHDGSAQEVRENCEKEIPDFLQEDATVFLDDVFAALAYRSYLPGAPPAPKVAPPQPQPPAAPPSGPRYPAALSGAAPAFAPQTGSRKRSYHDRGDTESRAGPGDRGGFGGRATKQPRRQGYGNAPSAYNNGAAPGPFQSHGFPPAGLPSAELEYDPMSLMPPMDALLPGFHPPPPGGFPPGAPHFPQSAKGQGSRRRRCRDYDAQGFCTRGNTCQYEHVPSVGYGASASAAQGQFGGYDPTNSSLLLPEGQSHMPAQLPGFPSFPGAFDPRLGQGRHGNGQGRGGRKNGYRSQLSADGPSHDKSKTTIVVENIPEEKFSEDEVRGFFSQFGNIVSVSMQPYKRLALVKFAKWGSANAAYRSPKVIFDNRFVRVFWHKEDGSTLPAPVPLGGSNGSNGSNVSNGTAGVDAKDGAANGQDESNGEHAEPDVDMEEFVRRQEEAQKAFDEKKRKKEEVERQRQELEERQKELLAKQQAEKEKLKAKMAAAGHTGKQDSSPEITFSKLSGPTSDKGGGRTDALRAQLAALEDEARSMGLNPNEMDEAPAWGAPPPLRGRGGYRGRGRGGYAPPWAGYPPRGGGGFRGRGGGHHAAYAAYSLDHRPKRVAVSGVDFSDSDKDEKLRHHLLGVGEFKDIQCEKGVARVTFNDRRTAEAFFNGVSSGGGILGIDGTLEVSWVPNSTGSGDGGGGSLQVDTAAKGGNGTDDKPPASGLASGRPDEGDRDEEDEDDNMGLDSAREAQSHANMDYDVADEENWDVA